jgi:hypothetical protein
VPLVLVVAVSYSLYKTTGERKVYEGTLLLSHSWMEVLLCLQIWFLLLIICKPDDDFTGLASALNIPDSLSKKKGVWIHLLSDRYE